MTEGRIAVFLDRDGTLNEEVNFVRSPEQFTMLPGAADAVGTLNRHGIIVCIISNQSGMAGIARRKTLSLFIGNWKASSAARGQGLTAFTTVHTIRPKASPRTTSMLLPQAGHRHAAAGRPGIRAGPSALVRCG